MAKPTLAAQLELANAKLAMAEAKIEELRAFARSQKTTIAALRGEVANLQEAAEVLPAPQRAASWAPSARLLAAKAQAMASGRCVKA